MRVVIDTNVLMSGIFFGGVPAQILDIWFDNKFTLVLSPEIIAEYKDVANRLSLKYPQVDAIPFLDEVIQKAEVILARELPEQVCTDSDDDKFLACANCGAANVIITGDHALQKVANYEGAQILTPANFISIFR